MKKILVSALVVAASVSAFAQGKVTFANDPANLASPPDRFVRYDSTAATLNPAYVSGDRVFSNGAAGLRAQLYFGASTADAGSLNAVSTAPTTFRVSTSANRGSWFSVADIVLPGTPAGSTVNLQVRVWDINLASSYEAATAMGAGYTGLIGTSLIFQYTVQIDPLATPAQYVGGNNNPGVLTSFMIGTVPEPSTIVLAGLGAAALLIFRRRK